MSTDGISAVVSALVPLVVGGRDSRLWKRAEIFSLLQLKKTAVETDGYRRCICQAFLGDHCLNYQNTKGGLSGASPVFFSFCQDLALLSVTTATEGTSSHGGALEGVYLLSSCTCLACRRLLTRDALAHGIASPSSAALLSIVTNNSTVRINH